MRRRRNSLALGSSVPERTRKMLTTDTSTMAVSNLPLHLVSVLASAWCSGVRALCGHVSVARLWPHAYASAESRRHGFILRQRQQTRSPTERTHGPTPVGFLREEGTEAVIAVGEHVHQKLDDERALLRVPHPFIDNWQPVSARSCSLAYVRAHTGASCQTHADIHLISASARRGSRPRAVAGRP